ncbi:MAG: rRNA adenine N-6-methyltransferase family protein, partial [Clostridia bacterium]
MVETIDFEECKCIVEYGPGTGIFTNTIINCKKADTKLIIVEKNEFFYSELLKKYASNKSVYVVNGGADEIAEYLSFYKVEKVDCIISGLPFTSMPKDISDKIFIKTKEILKSKGIFISFQYTMLMKKTFEKHFSLNKILFEIRNLPPAFVFVMENNK